MADFPGFKAGFKCVEVVLGFGLAVEDVAVQLTFLFRNLLGGITICGLSRNNASTSDASDRRSALALASNLALRTSQFGQIKPRFQCLPRLSPISNIWYCTTAITVLSVLYNEQTPNARNRRKTDESV